MSEAALVYDVFRGLGSGSRDAMRRLDRAAMRQIEAQYKRAIELKREHDARDRERWDHWIEVERIATERAETEAEIAAKISAAFDLPARRSRRRR